MREPQAYISNSGVKRTRRFLVFVLLFILVCGLGYWVLSYGIPGTDTTRGQYESALATWRWQNIEEYEMVVENRGFMLWSGIWTVRVLDGHVESAQLLDAHTGRLFNSPISDESIKHCCTIEGQFDRVDSILKYSQANNDNFCSVHFDQYMGYPSVIDCHPKPWISVTDSDTTMTVKSLKILRRGTPVPPQPTDRPTR